MRPLIVAFLLAAVASTAAAQSAVDLPAPPDLKTPPADATKGTNGLVSKMLSPGTSAERPLATDMVTVDYTGWSSDGRMFDSSIARGKPSTFPLDRSLPGWKECVQLMTVGEKRRCWVPEALAYRGQAGRPKGTVVFDIELLDTRGNPTVPPADVKGPPADARRTANGLAYKVLRPGTGTRMPSPFDKVVVHYTGWTTDGRMFDSSVARGTPATMGLDDVIRGWTEGVGQMVEGERTRFWIPEALAYKGEAGQPRGLLVFDIELVKIQ
jgi:FKBP-type peptidyl-prolyl cis-trans isomerase